MNRMAQAEQEIARQDRDDVRKEIRRMLAELSPYDPAYGERRAALHEALLNVERGAGATDRPLVGGVLRKGG